MKILVTGIGGQLGYDVLREGNKRGFDMFGTSSADLDITNKEDVYEYVRTLHPEVIIHCAAYTSVDKAEDDIEKVHEVNVNGTRYLAEVAKVIDAKLIYISTDYVFDGLGDKPYTEMNIPNPIGQYGVTKYQGEKSVISVLNKYFIVRVSWVFGINGNNFVKTMLRLSETREELSIVGDQVGSPTYTVDLACLLMDMVITDKYGIYHVTNEGFCSWSEFAHEIFIQANKKVKVHSIKTDEYPTRAVRPKNSRLSKQKIIDNGFIQLPPWQDSIRRFLVELDKEVDECEK
ncbi:dTDP-4-dehydrorhamnose reductase [Peribacillus sp. NPDC097295]|uniref:dTDP-4-dehydrorhamnose reductase n=1 Tax=Peribacillus sp. NPDC097295 TaxID=3364402 RepID=UPI0038165BED